MLDEEFIRIILTGYFNLESAKRGIISAKPAKWMTVDQARMRIDPDALGAVLSEER